MEDLIKALQIFSKYTNQTNNTSPTFCVNDDFYVNVNPKLVSAEDLDLLESLSFLATDCNSFYSKRFGGY